MPIFNFHKEIPDTKKLEKTIRELEKENADLKNPATFDFASLFEDPEDTGLITKYAPIIGIILNFIVLLILILKK